METYSQFINDARRDDVKIRFQNNVITLTGSCKPSNGEECRDSLKLIRENVDKLVTKFFEQFSDVCAVILFGFFLIWIVCYFFLVCEAQS